MIHQPDAGGEQLATDTTDEGHPDLLILPRDVELDQDSEPTLGTQGRPFDRRHPFFIGLAGAFGVAVAYIMFRGIADITSVLVIVGLALFIAIGLNPIIDRLIDHSLSRGAAVAIVTLGLPGHRRRCSWWLPFHRSHTSSTYW